MESPRSRSRCMQRVCHDGICGKWTIHHVIVFCLTFMGYAYFHATRKSFSNVKDTMSEEWTPTFSNATVNETKPDWLWNSRNLFPNTNSSTIFLGSIDSAFLFSYAIGLYISGFIGDRVDLRLLLTFGMCASAASVFLFGTLSEILHIYSIPYYMFFWILNGLLQSTGWPAMVAIMANWFGRSSRGFVLGLWSSCASVGNIIGALMASNVLKFGYEFVFLVPASVLFAGGIITFFGLVPHPKEIGLPSPDEEESNENIIKDETTQPLLSSVEDSDMNREPDYTEESVPSTTTVVPEQKALGFCGALLIPGVIPYSLSYACLKLVNYSFFFWLPFYLNNKYGWPQATADEISIWYDVGGIIGGTVGGFVSDRLKLRSPVVVVMLVICLPSIYGYSVSPNDKTCNSVLMAVAGFWIGGPSNLISAAIAADLGKEGSLQNNKQALATVTGIVDGTGSVGGALGQVLLPVVLNRFGWQAVFYIFMVMIGCTIICIIPMLVREIYSTRCCRHRLNRFRSENTTL